MYATSRSSPFVAVPRIFGDAVRARAVDIDRIELEPGPPPAHLARARGSRVREHLAGRLCAEAALRDAGSLDTTVGVAAEGMPLWPDGFVGSITHTGRYACAAVGPSARLRGLGIDSEPLLSADVLREIAPLLLVEAEEALLAGDDRLLAATLVFSAKESLYKCLRPLAGVFFELADACVDAIDRLHGRWHIRLRRDLPGFARGLRLVGRYEVSRGMVHTAVELPSEPGA
jgi:enterobactin synthetase component D